MAKPPRTDPDLLHRQAQTAALRGLEEQADLATLIAAISPTDVPGWFTPDVALLELAVAALDLAQPAGTAALPYAGIRERYLPEVTFSGRVEHRNSQYALYAAATMRGGLQPDLLADAGWWQTPLWIYATHALVIYSRAAAERNGSSVPEIAHQIRLRHAL